MPESPPFNLGTEPPPGLPPSLPPVRGAPQQPPPARPPPLRVTVGGAPAPKKATRNVVTQGPVTYKRAWTVPRFQYKWEDFGAWEGWDEPLA